MQMKNTEGCQIAGQKVPVLLHRESKVMGREEI